MRQNAIANATNKNVQMIVRVEGKKNGSQPESNPDPLKGGQKQTPEDDCQIVVDAGWLPDSIYVHNLIGSVATHFQAALAVSDSWKQSALRRLLCFCGRGAAFGKYIVHFMTDSPFVHTDLAC